MNRFQISLGSEVTFKKVWQERDSHLKDVPGFKNFNLIKSETFKDHTPYASHSTWASKADFINWTKSEAFRQAHQGAGKNKDMYLGHPVFEGFEVVL